MALEAGWNFDNSYARLPEPLFSPQGPTPVQAPKLMLLNQPLATALGLNAEALQSEDGVAVLAGNRIPDGALPLAQAYAGHQFGHFTMLGDGRAVLLGEQITPTGRRFDIQLKGAGRTPYSRGGDGRAALGPMLREYIISEAMHALGIPTTRSLAVVATGQSVFREAPLPGALVVRVAASHLRVGTFQYVAHWRPVQELQALADYTIDRHYPEIAEGPNRYLRLLQAVSERQASLIAKWQLVGFIHGVMNTDNMAISGETIDYGPCAFMDTYDPATVFSSIDRRGRYAYGNQPPIAQWNLARFAETLLPLLHEEQAKAIELAQDALKGFQTSFQHYWSTGMRHKLGIAGDEDQDESLIDDLLAMMQQHQADWTNTFRALTFDRPEETPLFGTAEFGGWYQDWRERLSRQQGAQTAAHQLMRDSNPAVIPRNHRVEEALSAAVECNDYSPLQRLLAAASQPYAHTPEQAEFTALPPESERPYRTFCGT